MEYAIKNKGGNYFVASDDVINIEDLLSIGYKPIHEGALPSGYNEQTMELKKEIIEREDGDYEYRYTAVQSEKKIASVITTLKQQLAETDYKVIKNMEYQMVMIASSTSENQIILDLYDAQEIHKERQALRDKINELENLLKQ